MLQSLQESFGNEVFTEQMQNDLEERINRMVDERAEEIAEKTINEKVDELETHAEEFKDQVMNEARDIYKETVDKKVNSLNEENDAYKKQLMEDAKKAFDEELAEHKAKIDESCEEFKQDVLKEAKELFEQEVEAKTQSLDEKCEDFKMELMKEAKDVFCEKLENISDLVEGYVDRVAEDFIAEHEKAFEINETEMKNEAIFQTLANACKMAGVTADMLDEDETRKFAVNESARELELFKALKEANAKLVDLQQQNENLVRLGVINELKEGLTYTQGLKFESIAMTVPYERSADYLSELRDLRESVINEGKREVVVDDEDKEEQPVNDSVDAQEECKDVAECDKKDCVKEEPVAEEKKEEPEEPVVAEKAEDDLQENLLEKNAERINELRDASSVNENVLVEDIKSADDYESLDMNSESVWSSRMANFL